MNDEGHQDLWTLQEAGLGISPLRKPKLTREELETEQARWAVVCMGLVVAAFFVGLYFWR